MRHVALLTGNPLCSNPRVQKEAEALVQAGFRVTVLGAWYAQEAKREDLELLATAKYQFEPVVDFSGIDAGARADAIGARVRTSGARRMHTWMGIESRWQLGYAVDGLLRRGRRSNADLYIAHSEAGLYAVRALLREGRTVGVDMEDWFSEDLPHGQRRGRPLRLLRELEAEVLRGAAHATCPSAAMSRALVERYGCVPPVVVYNAFPWADRQRIDGIRRDRGADPRPSIHWYSQTMGPGRGLDTLMTALPQIQGDVQVHLRGRTGPGFREFLLGLLPQERRLDVHFHGPVANSELLSRIAEHDIGFSGEDVSVRSRDLTITNKLFHYLLVGLPVAASDTAGSREISERVPEAVSLWSAGNANSLAAVLNAFLRDPVRFACAKAAALSAAETTYSWEQCVGALVSAVKGVQLESRGRARPTGAGFRA